MASIAIDEKTGLKRLMFFLGDKRVAVHMGTAFKVVDRSKNWQTRDKKANAVFCGHIEALVAHHEKSRAIPVDTAAWLADLDCDLRAKLERVALVEPLQPQPKQHEMLLGPFLAQWVAKRVGGKPNTMCLYKYAQKALLAVFGADKPLAAITEEDARDFRRNLLGRPGRPLSENTTRRLTGFSRQIFTSAVRSRLIAENPFIGKDLPTAVRGNKARFHMVTREEAQNLIDAVPSAEWRLAIALARYGGLRCPSEVLSLTWGDIDWARARILVHASKTEHHAGKDIRWIPLFPEMRPYLQQVFDEASEGSTAVIRLKSAWLKIGLNYFADREGIPMWKKPWQNMRASRENELLAMSYPAHVVRAWIGHTQEVAEENYLHEIESYFKKATLEVPNTSKAQNTAQRTAQTGCDELRQEKQDNSNPAYESCKSAVETGACTSSQDTAYLEGKRADFPMMNSE